MANIGGLHKYMKEYILKIEKNFIYKNEHDIWTFGQYYKVAMLTMGSGALQRNFPVKC